MAKFLVRLRIQRSNDKAKLLNMEIIGSEGIYEELHRLEKANPQAYGRLCQHGWSKYKTNSIPVVETHYAYFNSHGWCPPVAEIFSYLEDAKNG